MLAAPDHHDPFRGAGGHLDTGALTKADRTGKSPYVKKNLAGVDLPPEGVARHVHRDAGEGPDPGVVHPVRDEDHPRAGGKDPALELRERLIEPVFSDQPGDGGGLAARYRKCVEPCKVFRAPDRRDR